MIVVRYAVCSELAGKPVTRAVCESRNEAQKVLESARRLDVSMPHEAYWIAELGPECDAWRYLGRDTEQQAP